MREEILGVSWLFQVDLNSIFDRNLYFSALTATHRQTIASGFVKIDTPLIFCLISTKKPPRLSDSTIDNKRQKLSCWKVLFLKMSSFLSVHTLNVWRCSCRLPVGSLVRLETGVLFPWAHKYSRVERKNTARISESAFKWADFNTFLI